MYAREAADNVGMARIIAALLLFFIGNCEARANDWWDVLTNTPERLIGLLDLDNIVRGGCGPAPDRATARVYGAPSANGPSLGTLYWHEVPSVECDLMIERPGGIKEFVPTLESGYEIPAAIVYERRGPWFRIRLANGSAWIRRDDVSEFLPYPELIREKLPHVLQGWNGTLRATPSVSGKVTPLTAGWKEMLSRGPSIRLLDTRHVVDELWLRIELTTEERCGPKLEGMTPVSGWVPAYRLNRAPNVWFSSRGC
jgi:hypothetical protein